MAGAQWVDLLDPTEDELRACAPRRLHPSAIDQLLQPARHADEPRPRLEGQDTYVFGIFLIPVSVPHEDRVFYQEVDLVVTHETVLTVRKSPGADDPPFDPGPVQEACRKAGELAAGMVAFRIVDAVAEGFLDLIDDLNEEIDELEDHVEDWKADEVRERTLAPTRDAVHRVVDRRVDVEGEEIFPREIELHFSDAYDKLLRASDALELSRDLVAGVRDYHQSKIANDQNEVMKRLTAIASLLLLPTFIVGLYGQNFRHHFPELGWQYGYAFSWALILGSTLVQLAFFRWKRWI